MALEGQGAASGSHTEKPADWSLHCSSSPLQATPVSAASRLVTLGSVENTDSAFTFLFLGSMKTICLPLALFPQAIQ